MKKKNKNKNNDMSEQAKELADEIKKKLDQDDAAAKDGADDATDEVVEEAVSEVDALKAEVETLKSQLLRLGADYQNYQRRMNTQLEQTRQYASEGMLRSILPVVDNFKHALAKISDTEDVVSVLKGVQIVYDHLMGTLNTAGVKEISAKPGDEFDPSVHEAMMHQESSEIAENHVVMELACGYKLNDRVLIPAKVAVAKAPVAPVDDASEEEATDETGD